MALSHSRFALALVGAVTFTLQGCDDLQDQVSNFVGVVCKTTMTKIVEAAEIHYEKQVDDKCTELQKALVAAGLNIEKSKEAQTKCLDTAGVLINKDSDEQQTNYTEQCITALNNVTESGWSGVDKAVKKFVDSGDFTEQLNSLLEFNLGEEMDKIKSEYESQKDDSDGKTEDGDKTTDDKTADDEKDEQTDDKEDAKEDAKEEDDKASDDKEEEKTDNEEDAKEDAKEEDKKDDKQDDKTTETERLFDSAIHIPFTGKASSAALTCLFAGSLVAAIGMMALLRRGIGRNELEHECLIADDTDVADA